MEQIPSSKPGLLKILLMVVFFPFTLTYLIWKTKWDMKLKVGAIAGMWILFAIMGSGSSSQSATTSTDTQSAPVQQVTKVEPTAIPLEQKQADFKTLYAKYKTQSQAMILIQASIIELANTASNKAELYLALKKMEETQSNIAYSNLDVDVPESLKEYKDLRDGLSHFKIAGNNYTDAIKAFKEYVNKEDLEKLSKAKEQADRGTARLTESKNLIDGVAKELGLDTETL